MLKQIQNIALIACVTLFTFSCGSDDDGDGESSSAALSVAIDGGNFSTDTAVAILSNDGKLLSIVSTDINDGTSVSFTVGSLADEAPVLVAGSYSITEDSNNSIVYSDGESTFIALNNDGGMITISELDNGDMEVSGTFSASVSNTQIGGQDTFLLTSGQFNDITFTIQ